MIQAAISSILSISLVLAPTWMAETSTQMNKSTDAPKATQIETTVETLETEEETSQETEEETSQETEEVQTERSKDYSWVEPESDLWLIAKVICGEAQNCDRTEMEYVASVILNRVADPRFPNTIAEVVYQTNPLQYQCTRDANWYKTPTQANWEEAEYVLNMFNEYGYTVLPAGVVYQSQDKLGEVYEETDWHYYCYG